MPRIIHLSDLHFGAHDPRAGRGGRGAGQRGKARPGRHQRRFHPARADRAVQGGVPVPRAAREAGHEVLGVPGNHDVPLYDVLRRFLSPLTRYRRYIDDELVPVHELPGAAVLGINTARSLTFKDGRISHEQMDFIRETFAADRSDDAADPGHAPSPVRAAGRRRAGARQGGRAAGAGARRDRRGRASTCCWPGIIIAPRPTMPRDLVTRAGRRWSSRPGPRPRSGCATRSRASTASRSAGDGDGDGAGWDGNAFVRRDAQRYRRARATHWRSGDRPSSCAEAPMTA